MTEQLAAVTGPSPTVDGPDRSVSALRVDKPSEHRFPWLEEAEAQDRGEITQPPSQPSRPSYAWTALFMGLSIGLVIGGLLGWVLGSLS